MREIDRDLIRGEHYGQRSCEPHKQAEHMAAPTKSATWRFFLPTRSRPHMAQSPPWVLTKQEGMSDDRTKADKALGGAARGCPLPHLQRCD